MLGEGREGLCGSPRPFPRRGGHPALISCSASSITLRAMWFLGWGGCCSCVISGGTHSTLRNSKDASTAFLFSFNFFLRFFFFYSYFCSYFFSYFIIFISILTFIFYFIIFISLRFTLLFYVIILFLSFPPPPPRIAAFLTSTSKPRSKPRGGPPRGRIPSNPSPRLRGTRSGSFTLNLDFEGSSGRRNSLLHRAG